MIEEQKYKCYECGVAAGNGSSNSGNNVDSERLETEMQHFLAIVNSKERKSYVQQRIEATISKETLNREKYTYDYSVGRPGLVVRCCSNGFNKFYGISERTQSRRTADIRHLKCSQSSLTTSLCGSVTEVKSFEKSVMDKYGIELNDSEKCVIRMTESKSKYSTMSPTDECIAWLELFFETGAEEQPNRFNQRHLRQATITKKDISGRNMKRRSNVGLIRRRR